MKLNHRRHELLPFPFSEGQIRERAQALWQARLANGKAGTETEDWEAAKESLMVERSLPEGLRSLWSLVLDTEAQKTVLDVHKLQLEHKRLQQEWVKVVISGFGVLATIFAGVGLYLTYRNSQAQLESAQQERQLNTERLITDRFSKAIEQLGSQDIHVRLGGVYSLERIAKDSPKDQWTVMEVLAAFVRDKSPIPDGWIFTPLARRKPLPLIMTDVQSALTVIGRREVKNDPVGKVLNLSLCNLNNVDFKNAKLGGAELIGDSFSDGASFINADLVGARLGLTTLTGADFTNADITNARLHGADFSDASFDHANLKNTDFTGAHHLTTPQIRAAKNWQDAHYDPDFRKQLGLPSEKP